MVATIRRTLAGTAAAVCFAASFAANAAGVFYQSDFDPVDFFGSVTWHVQDPVNCLQVPDGYYGVNLFNTGPQCQVSISNLSYTVDYGGGNVANLQFGPESETNPFLVAGIWVIDNKFAGADTFLIGPLPGYGTSEGGYGVQFTSGYFQTHPIPSWLNALSPAFGNLSVPGAYLWEQTRSRCPSLMFNLYLCAREVDTTNPSGQYAVYTNRNADGTFPLAGSDTGQLPEPGSLALLGGALVAGWVVRRRRSA